MKRNLTLLLCGIAMLAAGCYRSGHLYPVQGPLAELAPPPVYNAKLSGALNSGNLTVTLPSGEVCRGRWAVLHASDRGVEQPGMASAWDTVYGVGFYRANVLGARLHVHSVVAGDKGTTLNVELYRRNQPEAILDIKGVAQDDKGNVYKVVL